MNNSKNKRTKRSTTTTTTTKTASAPKRNRKSRGGRNSRGVASNPYLLSLLLPSVTSAKIPDPSCLLTAVVTQTVDGTITANANNAGGLRVDLRSFGGTTATQSTAIFNEDSSTTSDTTFTYLAAAVPSGGSSFQSAFVASRLVSASLEVEFLGSSLNDQGRIHAVSTFGTRFVVEPTVATVTAALAARDNMSCPVTKGCYMRWKPADDTCDDFGGSSAATNSLGSLMVHVSGVATGTILRTKIVLNYECLPLTDTVSYASVSPSPVDDAMYAQARNVAATYSSFDYLSDVGSYLSRGASGILYGATGLAGVGAAAFMGKVLTTHRNPPAR